MTLMSRKGAAPLAFLLGGIAVVIIVFGFAIFGKQAKASADLKEQLNDANTKLVASGLEVSNATTSDKSSESLFRKTSKQSKAGMEYLVPSTFKVKSIDGDSTEIASKEEYFGQVSIPKNEIRMSVEHNVNFQLSGTLESYVNDAPYATDHTMGLVNGLQYLLISNRHSSQEWQQLVVARSTQGPYDVFTIMPSGAKTNQFIDLLTTSIKLVEGNN